MVRSQGKWLALIAALLGWMFDGMEMGLFPQVATSALSELIPIEPDHHSAAETLAEHLQSKNDFFRITGPPDGDPAKSLADTSIRFSKSLKSKDVDGLIAQIQKQPAENQDARMLELLRQLREKTAVREGHVNRWFGITTALFLVGAATGGVLFGWLGDKIGRVRAMTLSVLTYSLCSGLSMFSLEPWHLAGMRFLGALGMGGEWALGIALVMEVWPNASRAALAGWIGAFGNLGYTIVGFVMIGLNESGPRIPGVLQSIGISETWALKLTSFDNWRLMMFVGALPALLTLLIRLFVPESEKWTREKEAGHASQWSGVDLIAVLIGAVAACGIVAIWSVPMSMAVRVPLTAVALAITLGGYIYPAARFVQRSGMSPVQRRMNLGRMLLGAGLSGVPLLATWAGFMWYLRMLPEMPGYHANAKPIAQISSSIGAAIGCVLIALLAGRFGRRIVYASLCIVSWIALYLFFSMNTQYGWEFVVSVGVVGLITASFYGWLPLYLPELFPTKMRASGQGFGFNFGRIIAAIGNLQTVALLSAFDNNYARATVVTASVYAVGLVLIYFAPETHGKDLPD